MDNTAALLVAPSIAEECDEPPFARDMVVLSKLEYIDLKSQRNFFKTQHEDDIVFQALRAMNCR